MSESNKERYEQFLKIVREAEFSWNVEPEDLEVVAAFLRAKAETKRIMRKATEAARNGVYTPLPSELEDEFLEHNGDVA